MNGDDCSWRGRLWQKAAGKTLKDFGSRFNPGWEEIERELKELLSPEEFAAARASTLNAHYTSKTVINGIYGALQRLGLIDLAVEAQGLL